MNHLDIFDRLIVDETFEKRVRKVGSDWEIFAYQGRENYRITVVVAENDLIMRNIFLDFRVGETIALGFSTPPEFPE